MYYDDGTVVPYYVGLGGTIATKTEDLVRVFQEALTQEEIDILKSKITCSLQLDIVTDKQGKYVGGSRLDYVIMIPVMTKFDPDRLYQLEAKFEKNSKT